MTRGRSLTRGTQLTMSFVIQIFGDVVLATGAGNILLSEGRATQQLVSRSHSQSTCQHFRCRSHPSPPAH